MKVILMENVDTLGKAGTVKEVANGYARNYLLPRGLAMPATAEALKRLERQRTAIERRALQVATDAQSMGERISGTTVYVYAKSGEQNRLYGTVTTAVIADALAAQEGLTIDRRNISLAEPIHRLGNYTANVKLPGGVVGKLNVVVDSEANRGKPRATAVPAAAPEATAAPTAEVTTAEATTVEAAPVAEATIAEAAPVAEVNTAEASAAKAAIAEAAPVAEAATAEATAPIEASAAETNTAEAAPVAEATTAEAITLDTPAAEATSSNDVESNAGESSYAHLVEDVVATDALAADGEPTAADAK